MQPAHLKENECQNDDSSVSDMSVKSNHSDVSSLGGNLTPEHADSERQSADSGEEVAADKVVAYLDRKDITSWFVLLCRLERKVHVPNLMFKWKRMISTLWICTFLRITIQPR